MKRVLILLIILPVLFLAALVWINLTIMNTGSARIKSRQQLRTELDAIIVPGCKVYLDGTPSPMLKDRLDGAVLLYGTGVSDRIIVSGDSSVKELDEPWIMRNYLVAAGIPPESIFLDNAGLDTYATVYRAREIFGVQTGVVTTQRFHLLRALYIAERLGIDLFGFETDFYEYSTSTVIKNSIRDFFARGKAWIETQFKVQPRYLDETYDLSDSGLATLSEEQKANDPFINNSP
ncbi:MAG TPA: DUF218 domain-containing protein [Clostridiaceae bacterium]|nr:DUF218 domain-containing protein [Clostridiaceae bacterium]